MRKSTLLLSTLALTACDSTASSDYDNLTGNFAGTTRSSEEGFLAATAVEVVDQTEGDLNGTWGLTGLLDERLPVSMDGTFEGTVEKGRDPVVSFSLDDGCGRVRSLSGEYETLRQRLVLSGDIVLTDFRCEASVLLAVEVELTKRPGS